MKKLLLILVVGMVLLVACTVPQTQHQEQPTPSSPSSPISTPTPTLTLAPTVVIQEGSNLSKMSLEPKRSPELEDNHIAVGLGTCYKENVPTPSDFYLDSYGADPELVYSLGFKWIRIAFDDWVGDPLNW